MSRHRTVWMSNFRRSLCLVGENFAGLQFHTVSKIQGEFAPVDDEVRECMFPQCVNKVLLSIWSLFASVGTKS